MVELFLERIGLRELLGRELPVQAQELVDAHVLAHRLPQKLLDPMHAGFGRKLVEELLQHHLALAIRGDLYVMEQEYLVEADLQVRNEVLTQESLDPALHGLSKRRITVLGRPPPVPVAGEIVSPRPRHTDVRALERRTEPI